MVNFFIKRVLTWLINRKFSLFIIITRKYLLSVLRTIISVIINIQLPVDELAQQNFDKLRVDELICLNFII